MFEENMLVNYDFWMGKYTGKYNVISGNHTGLSCKEKLINFAKET